MFYFSFSLQLITWNVAIQFPDSLNLSCLLDGVSPDLVLFGLQEVKSQPQNLLADNLLAGEDPWTSRLRSDLTRLGYVKVKSIRLVGIVLSLFCLSKHIGHIRGNIRKLSLTLYYCILSTRAGDPILSPGVWRLLG